MARICEARHADESAYRLLIPPNVPAGMNPLVVMSLAYLYRSTTEDVEPITVAREGRNWRIVDGRHRFVASVIAGRRRVLAVVETPTGAETP